jgi:hypothetical protein
MLTETVLALVVLVPKTALAARVQQAQLLLATPHLRVLPLQPMCHGQSLTLTPKQ